MNRAAPVEPPCFAVIFTSRRTEGDNGYAAMAEHMLERASQQPGFLGVESVRDRDGAGITVSYWEDLDSIAAWKMNAEHRLAQDRGQAVWYSEYTVRIARIERVYGGTLASR